MAHQHVRQSLQFVARVGRAGRVRGRVEHDPLGARGDRTLQVLGLQLERLFDRRRHDDRLAAVDQHHLRIADPIGRRDDDLVALVHRDEEGVVEDLLAAGADDRVRGLVIEAVLALELGRDRLAQRRNAEHGRILGLAALDRLDRRLLDVVRRIEIRLAHRKRDDLPPLGFEIARLLRHRDGRGWLNARKDVGDKGHEGVFPFHVGEIVAPQHNGAVARRQPIWRVLTPAPRLQCACPAFAFIGNGDWRGPRGLSRHGQNQRASARGRRGASAQDSTRLMYSYAKRAPS